MKFFIVTCVKESRKTAFQLFRQANINAFSSTDVIGFKDNQQTNPLEEWFARGDEQFDSEMIFSFTSDANARKAMSLIVEYNEKNPTQFPIRAFMVPVEMSSFSS